MSETTSYTRLGSWRELEGKTIKAVLTNTTDWNGVEWPLIIVTEDGKFLTAEIAGDYSGYATLGISALPGGPCFDVHALHLFASPDVLFTHGIINSGELRYWAEAKKEVDATKRDNKAYRIKGEINRLQQELALLEGGT